MRRQRGRGRIENEELGMENWHQTTAKGLRAQQNQYQPQDERTNSSLREKEQNGDAIAKEAARAV